MGVSKVPKESLHETTEANKICVPFSIYYYPSPPGKREPWKLHGNPPSNIKNLDFFTGVGRVEGRRYSNVPTNGKVMSPCFHVFLSPPLENGDYKGSYSYSSQFMFSEWDHLGERNEPVIPPTICCLSHWFESCRFQSFNNFIAPSHFLLSHWFVEPCQFQPLKNFTAPISFVIIPLVWVLSFPDS